MNAVDSIKKYYPFFFFVVIILLSIFLFQSRATLKQERADREYEQKQDEQNQKALLDSINSTFNKKLKAWEYSKDNYVVQKLSDLEEYNKSLADELKKIKGDVISAIKTEVQGDLGGITASTGLEKLDEETNYYGLTFKSNYKDNSFEQKLEGIVSFILYQTSWTKLGILNQTKQYLMLIIHHLK